MSVSLNSPSDSTNRKKLEEVADLSLNQDEVLDLEMALGALGGLRHTAACDAADRSNRRFDDRNHRLHESRMKALGLEGEEKEPETDDMSQQVLIRSPVIHNHYLNGEQQPVQNATQQTPATPATPPKSLPTWVKAGVATALLGSGGLGGLALASLLLRPDTAIPQFVDTDTDTTSGLGLVPPGPPMKKVQ